PLRRKTHPRPRHPPGIPGPGGHLDPGDLAGRLRDLRRRPLPGVEGLGPDRRAVLEVAGAGQLRRERRPRGRALPDGPPHPRGRTGPGRFGLAARGRHRRRPRLAAAPGPGRLRPPAPACAPARRPARPAAQSLTRPPSTTRFCPVTARDQGEAKNSTASANSTGVVTRRSGVPAAIRSKTASGVAALASVVRNRPPDTM